MNLHLSQKIESLSRSVAGWVVLVLLCTCGGGGGGGQDGSSSVVPVAPGGQTNSFSGVVTATAFIAGSATEPTFAAGYYQGALVCSDSNGNGRCDAGEGAVTTNSRGQFTLAGPAPTGLIADIGTAATNSASSTAVTTRLVLRVSAAQIADQGAATVVISPLSSEVQRQVEANGGTYANEKQNLANRLGVALDEVLEDVNAGSGATRSILLAESNALVNRYAYATTKLDRGDLFPDALAFPGGDPELSGLAGVTAATATVKDTRSPITFLQSQQAAFNVEGIPRYDHIFIVMLENKAQSSILNSPFAPHINAFLAAGNQFTSYFASGNPSEANYVALGGGDDFGITDDNQWNCNASGASAVQDLPLPDASQPGLASSPFQASCSIPGAAVHNIVGRPNLFSALSAAGLSWRVYAESMNPGQDPRTAGVADAAVVAPDHVYAPGTLAGNAAAVGDPKLLLPLPAHLYETKHHPGMAYQSVRSAPEFRFSNRTLGGGQWDGALSNSTAYAVPAAYSVDQFGADLESGNVGNLNFLIPDQCDDMHGIPVGGTVAGTSTGGTASDCSAVANNVANATGGPIVARSDNFVGKLVARIQASRLWKNPQRKVLIVLMFDEGNASSGFNSCCGWNPGNSTVAKPLLQNADGSYSIDSTVAAYSRGNRGHGESIFGVLSNQPGAPKGIKDSDAYSHFSFVRTLQDMFQLADPARPGTYMNRSKYSEKFIAQHLSVLPEYAASADTHFDAVRPMNHAFVIPPAYTQKQSDDSNGPLQVGPDATQINVWALH